MVRVRGGEWRARARARASRLWRWRRPRPLGYHGRALQRHHHECLRDAQPGAGAPLASACAHAYERMRRAEQSPEARQASQLLFRTLAVLTESYVFVYLGMSLFTFPIVVEVPLWVWSLVRDPAARRGAPR